MVYCSGCGNQLHELALSCPKCGLEKKSANERVKEEPMWQAITSLVIGIFCALVVFDDSPWDRDTKIGQVIIGLTSIVFGVFALNVSRKGRGMAIAGIVASVFGLLSIIVD